MNTHKRKFQEQNFASSQQLPWSYMGVCYHQSQLAGSSKVNLESCDASGNISGHFGSPALLCSSHDYQEVDGLDTCLRDQSSFVISSSQDALASANLQSVPKFDVQDNQNSSLSLQNPKTNSNRRQNYVTFSQHQKVSSTAIDFLFFSFFVLTVLYFGA